MRRNDQQSKTQAPPPAAPVGAKSRAQTEDSLRDILEKIKGDAQRALALLPSEPELRSLGWKCTACGHVKHFTRAGHGCGRRPVSEMQRRFLSSALSTSTRASGHITPTCGIFFRQSRRRGKFSRTENRTTKCLPESERENFNHALFAVRCSL